MKYDIFKYMFSVTDAKVMNIYNGTQVFLFFFLLTNYCDYSTVTRISIKAKTNTIENKVEAPTLTLFIKRE